MFKLDDASSKSFKYAVEECLFQFHGSHNASSASRLPLHLFSFYFLLFFFFRFLRINVPAGGHPTAVAFSDGPSSVVVASQTLSGSSLYMYGEEKPKANEQGKLPLPEIKWEHHKVHEKRATLTLSGATASYGTADGSTVIASCSEGICC